MSGTGNYHGFYGFKAFSHERNIMVQKSFDVVQYFHPPYHKQGSTNRSMHEKIQSITEKALRKLKGM